MSCWVTIVMLGRVASNIMHKKDNKSTFSEALKRKNSESCKKGQYNFSNKTKFSNIMVLSDSCLAIQNYISSDLVEINSTSVPCESEKIPWRH